MDHTHGSTETSPNSESCQEKLFLEGAGPRNQATHKTVTCVKVSLQRFELVKSKRNVTFSESDMISLIQSDKDNLFIYRRGHSETQYYKSFLDWRATNGEEDQPASSTTK